LCKQAFFDLDDTLIKGSSGLKLARILSTYCEEERWKKFWGNQNLFKKSDYDEAIIKLSHFFGEGVKDIDVKIMKKSLIKLKKEIKIKKGFIDLYEWLKKNKFKIFVLTASPLEVFNSLPNFNFTGVYGLLLEKNSKYTGNCTPMTTQKKREVINDLINENTIYSFGVTDSINDIVSYSELDEKFLITDTKIEIDKNTFCMNDLTQVLQHLKTKENL